MARKLKNLNPTEYEDAADAVLKHHFDIHSNCGCWCKRKDMTTEQKAATRQYYRSMDKDQELYNLLRDKLNKYTSRQKLEDLAHGMDTNCNESFNNTVSWFAPKNKVYCGSWSLWNRIALAIGVTSIGVSAYFCRLFKALGIPLTPNVEHFLCVKERQRQKGWIKFEQGRPKRKGTNGSMKSSSKTQ